VREDARTISNSKANDGRAVRIDCRITRLAAKTTAHELWLPTLSSESHSSDRGVNLTGDKRRRA
jgi:hypothetical protein